MRSDLFAASNQEQESAQAGLRLQNSKLLKVELRGEVFARQGSMVAYQGNVTTASASTAPTCSPSNRRSAGTSRWSRVPG